MARFRLVCVLPPSTYIKHRTLPHACRQLLLSRNTPPSLECKCRLHSSAVALLRQIVNALQFVTVVSLSMAFGYLSHSTPPSTSTAPPIAPHLPPSPPSPKQRPILGCRCPLHQPMSLLWLCDEFSCIAIRNGSHGSWRTFHPSYLSPFTST